MLSLNKYKPKLDITHYTFMHIHIILCSYFLTKKYTHIINDITWGILTIALKQAAVIIHYV